MVVLMSRPWQDKHLVYYLRVRTPADLIDRVKNAEIPVPIGEATKKVRIREHVQVSLGTKKLQEAKVLFPPAHAAVVRFWEEVRSHKRELTDEEAEYFAGRLREQFATERPEVRKRIAGIDFDKPSERELYTENFAQFWQEHPENARLLERVLGKRMDALLIEKGILGSELLPRARAKLLFSALRAIREAWQQEVKLAKGDYRPDPSEARFPTSWPGDASEALTRLTLTTLFDQWKAHPENAEVSASTSKAYRSAISQAADALGDPRVEDISTIALRRYFDDRMLGRIPPKLLPKTIRDVHKAALRSVLGWAQARGLISANPAQEIGRIKVISGPVLRGKSATRAETQHLVSAALRIPGDVPQSRDAALRWCSLLLLYTGCRVGEIAQLRVCDVIKERARLTLNVTPEAGNVKSRRARLVPVHPRLVTLGFSQFVETAKSNGTEAPLFYDPSERRKPGATTPIRALVADRLSDWAREFGLGDKRLKRPLHSLRHRFMTQARDAGIETPYIEAIAGHASAGINSRYGEFSAEALHREIRKLDPKRIEGEVV